jgi:transglutaminase-like putative cysteine protease
MNPTLERPAARRLGTAALNAPRWLMSWEDWLTFAAALVSFLAVAVSIQNADWVPRMPPVVPTMVGGLAIGLLAARIRIPWPVAHLAALALGFIIVTLAVQSYADGGNVADRLEDVRLRLVDWWHVVRANEISNDRLPFVAIVQVCCFVAAYAASYTIYRWHNPWLAILPGGVVLLANVALQDEHPTGALVIFLFGAMLLVARLHLQQLQSLWKKDDVEYPEFISIDAGQLTLGLLAAVVIGAWLLPSASETKSIANMYDALTSPFTGRSGAFDRLFHNITGQSGDRLHTFDDVMPIKGDVTLGTRRLYEVRAPEIGFLRGTSYDEYTGNGWKSTDRDGTRIEGGELAATGEDGFQSRVGVTLEVTAVDPDGSILTYGLPLGTNEPITAHASETDPTDIEEFQTRRGLREGDTYNSFGSVSIATPEELLAAGTTYPQSVLDRYLQVPDDLPDRVGAEARRVTSGAGTPYEMALAIRDYLRGFPYDPTVPATPHDRDAVDYFLFDLKRGYFDYSSTAMAVMLRTLGVPARLAVGYQLDPADASGGSYTVRKNDATSVVEVYFPTYGWVMFNPNANQPISVSGGGISPGVNDLEGILSGAELEQLFGEIGTLTPGAEAALEALNEEPTAHDDPPWTLIYSLIGALVAMVALGLAGRITWNWGLSGLEGPIRMWARVERLAGWASLAGRPAETPRELASRVGTAVESEKDADILRRAYEHSRYGPPETDLPQPEEVEPAYIRLRNALLKLVAAVRIPGRRTG